MSRPALIVTKAAVSAALLTWILSRSDLGELLAAAGRAEVRLLVAAYLLHFVGVMITAARWRGLLRAHGVAAPMSFLVKSVMVGVFFNQFLPSTVGGDAMRAYDSFRLTRRGAPMTSVVVDRFLGMLVLTAFALVSIPFAQRLTSRVPMLPLMVVVGASVLAAVAWLIFAPPSTAVSRILAKLPVGVGAPAQRVARAFNVYRDRRSALVVALGWSVLLQANVMLYYILVARSLALPVPPLAFFLIVPLVLYVMMIPITVNGIGLRENMFAFFFSAYAIGTADAIAFAWLAFFGGLIQGVLGGIIYAVRRVDQGSADVAAAGQSPTVPALPRRSGRAPAPPPPKPVRRVRKPSPRS